MILSHAAQLAYVEDSRGAYELLSRTDRLLRYLDGHKRLVPVAEELQALGLYVEIVNLCAPFSMEFESDLAPAKPFGAMLRRGAAIDAADAARTRGVGGNWSPLGLSVRLDAPAACVLSFRQGASRETRTVALEYEHDPSTDRG